MNECLELGSESDGANVHLWVVAAEGQGGRFRPIADSDRAGQTARMGKRSGVPHTDDELDKLTGDELRAELDRSRSRLTIAPSARVSKQWHKRIHWLEAAIERRT